MLDGMRIILTITIPPALLDEIESLRKEKDISRSAAAALLIELGAKKRHEGGV